jgi:hypothetical protein
VQREHIYWFVIKLEKRTRANPSPFPFPNHATQPGADTTDPHHSVRRRDLTSPSVPRRRPLRPAAMGSVDLVLKPACEGCGSPSDLYGTGCKHTTLCSSCGKKMALSRARCLVCSAPITNLIRVWIRPFPRARDHRLCQRSRSRVSTVGCSSSRMWFVSLGFCGGELRCWIVRFRVTS